jgi:hypothetical protein
VTLPKHRRLRSPGPWPPDPPRCCTCLQRVTTRRSRSFGFAAPPAPFSLAGWTLAYSGAWPAGRLPDRPGYHSWPCTHPRGPRPLLRPRFQSGERPPSLRRVRPPWRSAAPPALPTRGIHFPTRRSLAGSHRLAPVAPRRGLPHPLRSVFAVSHDLDGLLLPEPCDVFRSHTPMGFGFPAPRWLCPFGPAEAFSPGRGGRCSSRKAPGWRRPSGRQSSRSMRRRRSDRRGGRSDSGSPRAFASRLIGHPLAETNVRPVTSPRRVAPSWPPHRRTGVA